MLVLLIVIKKLADLTVVVEVAVLFALQEKLAMSRETVLVVVFQIAIIHVEIMVVVLVVFVEPVHSQIKLVMLIAVNVFANQIVTENFADLTVVVDNAGYAHPDMIVTVLGTAFVFQNVAVKLAEMTVVEEVADHIAQVDKLAMLPETVLVLETVIIKLADLTVVMVLVELVLQVQIVLMEIVPVIHVSIRIHVNECDIKR